MFNTRDRDGTETSLYKQNLQNKPYLSLVYLIYLPNQNLQPLEAQALFPFFKQFSTMYCSFLKQNITFQVSLLKFSLLFCGVPIYIKFKILASIKFGTFFYQSIFCQFNSQASETEYMRVKKVCPPLQCMHFQNSYRMELNIFVNGHKLDKIGICLLQMLLLH